MTPRLKKMWELAIREAKNLKKITSDHEKDMLDLKTFSAEKTDSCIYGQMTGDCNSNRATYLIIKSCKRVYNTAPIKPNTHIGKAELNGAPKDVEFGWTNPRTHNYISPIEILIFRQHGGRKAAKILIDFIKGKTKRIEIPD